MPQMMLMSVGSEQREDLAAPDLQIHGLQSLESGLIDFRQLRNGDDRLQGSLTRTSAVSPILADPADPGPLARTGVSLILITLYWISILRGRFSARFGMVSVRTPSFTVASMRSGSSSRPRAKLRR